ncbi:MAG: magnesium and cobalt transport protein CorA [Candidatus Magasanikbacteria bacterium CG10_big_fil_rev_8_21_14_0_10_40_10]|uniref:Magnesium transport protein CorA n=1 Tax=Candidatus Magasanikbacteria bacterium CG10_big_fil_rev_8_21_14_0_10_40_10 TaxID=1974648 RepID=A0A2M6W3J1_9BACT|nr:MAG: magnesium and cobalt transport protein CorA [Candidatus Magasanikbacteria bacterium CG10_big_fil_rev_8_21_14_0_10_40_10]
MSRKKINEIEVFDYDQTQVVEKKVKSIEDCVVFKDTPSITWINIDKVPPISFLKQLRLGFDLHPVVVEDILNMNQRPKVEFLDDYIFLTMRMMRPDKKTAKFTTEQVSIVISHKYLMTFQQGVKGDTFEPVRKIIRQPGTRLRSLGTDYLCYELINSMINGYFEILENFNDTIEKMEKAISTHPSANIINSIHSLKRQLFNLRRAVWPLREAISVIEHADCPLIKKATRIYLRDSYERLVQIIDTIEIYRDILSGLLDLYLSTISNRTNSVMKVLTMIATIFMPLSFLAGVYGMNFQHLPGLASPLGPLAITGVMLAVFIGMLFFFKSKKWL